MAITINKTSRYGDWGYYGGQELNRRTHDAFVKMHLLAGVPLGQVYQGGLSGGSVSASAGTHNGLDVIDFNIAHLSRSQQFRVVSKGMECGMIVFLRGIVDRMTLHAHGVMVGAKYAHPEARAQLYGHRYSYSNGGAGLAGAPGARWWGPARTRMVTWAESKHNPANQVAWEISLNAVVWGMTNGKNPGKLGAGDNDGEQLQRLLQRQGLYTDRIDGVLGPRSRAAYEAWQARLFNVPKSHKWADGIPAAQSLKALGCKVVK